MTHDTDEKASEQAVIMDVLGHGDVEASEGSFTEADVGDYRPGYTKKDQKDMYRMGKRQELMVGPKMNDDLKASLNVRSGISLQSLH